MENTAANQPSLQQRLDEAIAERIKVEQALLRTQRELNRTVGELEQFTYIVSHDLQAPLRNIAGFVQLLDRRYRDRLDGDALEFMGYISSGVRYMQALMNDLLRFSRIGRAQDSQLSEQALATTVQRSWSSLGQLAQPDGAQLVIDGELPAIKADHALLGQLLTELFTNALKFQPTGHKAIVHVAACRDGDFWRISVTDNGIGIAASQLETVFAVFRRLHAEGDYEGTGMGLAICRKIVSLHGGRIWAESTGEGQGSRLVLQLPLEPVIRDAKRMVEEIATGDPVL